MDKKILKQKEFDFRFDSTELSSKQIRLVKSISSLLNHVMTTDDEGDYFESSSELMELIACAIKQSNYHLSWAENKNISYSDQAIEYSLDNLNDAIGNNKLQRFDN